MPWLFGIVLVRRRRDLVVIGEDQAGDLERVREGRLPEHRLHHGDERRIVGERVELFELLHLVVGLEELGRSFAHRAPGNPAAHEHGLWLHPPDVAERLQHAPPDLLDGGSVEQVGEVEVAVAVEPGARRPCGSASRSFDASIGRKAQS